MLHHSWKKPAYFTHKTPGALTNTTAVSLNSGLNTVHSGKHRFSPIRRSCSTRLSRQDVVPDPHVPFGTYRDAGVSDVPNSDLRNCSDHFQCTFPMLLIVYTSLALTPTFPSVYWEVCAVRLTWQATNRSSTLHSAIHSASDPRTSCETAWSTKVSQNCAL
jgi:hypothetical protein